MVKRSWKGGGLRWERGREVGYAGEKEERHDRLGGEWWGERQRERAGGTL